uniref:Uncharacterized protein n=1 Tax=Anguilla anguilla TaxID=7936 RepID=A0A0E9PC35_ANGAN
MIIFTQRYLLYPGGMCWQHPCIWDRGPCTSWSTARVEEPHSISAVRRFPLQ